MPFLANCHIPQTHDCVFFPLYYIHHFSPLTSQTMAAFSFSSSFHFFPNNIINDTSLSLHNPITTTTTNNNSNNLQLQVLELQDHPHQFYHQQNKQAATAPPPPLPLPLPLKNNNNNINDDELSCVLMSVVPNNNKSTTEIITPNPKRRRRRPKQGAGSSTSTPNSTIKVVGEGDHELKGTGGKNKKRKKKMDEESKESWKKSKEKKEKAAAGDYVHVRARRGQATDSHSLAERVRRERISERMKLLQALVPGCDKVTGKALMLDEIINYVQSLQNQVEFLSMKLAAVNPMLYEFGMDLEPFMLSPLQDTISGNICYPHLDNSINSFGLQQPQILPNAAAMTPQLQGHRQALLWEVEEQRQEIIDETGSGSGTLFSFH